MLGVILILLSVSCVNKTDEIAVVSLVSDELDIINHIIKTMNQENSMVIINEHIDISYFAGGNTRNSIYTYLKKTKIVDNDLLNSFKNNNRKQMVMDKSIQFDFNFIWNGNDAYNSDPIPYYGILTFSKVGFTKGQTKAIIYVGIMMEGNGKGNYYILEKENNEWNIIDIIGGWIT